MSSFVILAVFFDALVCKLKNTNGHIKNKNPPKQKQDVKGKVENSFYYVTQQHGWIAPL